MNNFYLINIFISFFLSGCCASKESKFTNTVKYRQNIEKKVLGVENTSDATYKIIDLSSYLHPMFEDSLSIYNSKGELYLKIFNGKIETQESTIDLFEDNTNRVEKLIPSISFYPEYYIWFVEVKLDSELGVLYFPAQNDFKSIKRGNLILYSMEDFLRDRVIGLNESSPLYDRPDTTSSIVDNYKEYDYQIDEFDDEWIKVKLSEHTPPGEESYKDLGISKVGWVKWRDNNRITIDFFYSE